MNSSAIHPDDFLHKFILRKFPKDGADRYFEGGKREATAVRAMIERYFPPHSPIRVIDFAAGYGRVVRHLPAVMPKATVAASDIHPQACQFMRENFDIEVYQSTREPEELDLGDSYDFIYVHSLFSHLPPHSFQRWLAALYRHTKPGGYLMVTTNGDFAREKLPNEFLPCYDPEKGYGYRPLVVDQPDIPTEDYGSMSISPDYFRAAVTTTDSLARIVSFRPGAILSHQDEWIIRKPN